MKKCFLVFAVLLWSFAGFAVAAEEQVKKKYEVILANFDLVGAGEYSQLVDSIQNMFISRLGSKDRIQVIDRVLSARELAGLKNPAALKKLQEEYSGVDYIITGTLYGVKQGVRIQTVLYPLSDNREVLRLSELVTSRREVISAVDSLVTEIAESAFGYEPVRVSENGISGFTTQHPEANYKRGLYTGVVFDTGVSGLSAKASGVRIKKTVKGEIATFELADLDGDGQTEIVALEGSQLKIYREVERKIILVDKVALKSGLRVHNVSIGDITGDDVPEICLSATEDLLVSSVIIRWSQAGGFVKVADNIRFYIRVVNIPAAGPVLLVQERGVEKVDFIKRGVRRAALESGRVVAGGELPLPDLVNIFDFTYADLDGDGRFEIAAIGGEDRLKIYNSANELLWVSDERYNGSKRYLGPSQGAAVNEQDRKNLSVNENADRELIFVPGRIQAVDVNNDGKSEIIVDESKMANMSWFKRMRPYTRAAVTGLVWNGQELVEAWRTGQYKGYLSGFALLLPSPDSASSGRKGLLYATNIPGSGTFGALLPGTAKTDISVLELEFVQKVSGGK